MTKIVKSTDFASVGNLPTANKSETFKPECLINPYYLFTDLSQRIESSQVDIDSLKIRIPYHLITPLHSDLTDTFLKVNESTGETSPLKVSKSVFFEFNGVKVVFKLERINTQFQERGKLIKCDYLTVTLNSKCLLSRYFEGINENTIVNIYDFIQSLNIVHFEKEAFNESLCTDIDLKCDFNIDFDFDLFTKHLTDFSRPSAKSSIGYNRFNKATNKGIEFQKRTNNTDNISRPYLKFYSKRHELIYNSEDFYKAYLGDIEIPQVRIETTIKNKAHLKSLDIKDNTLHNIIKLSQEKKKKILNNAIDRNLQYKVVNPPNVKLAAKDLFIHFLISSSSDLDFESSFAIFCQQYPISDKQKKTLKKRLKTIFQAVN